MEEQKIINVIINIFNGSDKHDWDQVLNCFHYEVFLDYFSLSKKPGGKVKPADVVKGWSDFLPRFTFTHHMITNFEISIEGASAAAFCKGYALHHLPGAEGGDMWTIIGTYDLKLIKVSDQWKVNSLTFNLLYEDGNKNLPSIATQETLVPGETSI